MLGTLLSQTLGRPIDRLSKLKLSSSQQNFIKYEKTFLKGFGENKPEMGFNVHFTFDQLLSSNQVINP